MTLVRGDRARAAAGFPLALLLHRPRQTTTMAGDVRLCPHQSRDTAARAARASGSRACARRPARASKPGRRWAAWQCASTAQTCRWRGGAPACPGRGGPDSHQRPARRPAAAALPSPAPPPPAGRPAAAAETSAAGPAPPRHLPLTLRRPGPPQMDEYEWIVIAGGIFGFMAAYGIGANDVANAFASSVGAKSLTPAQVRVLCCSCCCCCCLCCRGRRCSCSVCCSCRPYC